VLKLSPLALAGGLLFKDVKASVAGASLQRRFAAGALAETFTDSQVASFDDFNYYDVLDPEVDLSSWTLRGKFSFPR
jgi:hypothetical protein